jgi:hypothetical protein
MPWYIGTAIGAMALGWVQYWGKTHQITLQAQALVLVPLIICNTGFWYGFLHSDNFLRCWYTGSALSAIAGFSLSLFVFDKSISLLSIVGVALIIGGQQLLGR